MKTNRLICLLFIIVIWVFASPVKAQKQKPGGASPTETVKQASEALKKNDLAVIKGFLCKKLAHLLTAENKADWQKAIMQRALFEGEDLKGYSFSEDLNGDAARVIATKKADGGASTLTIDLSKEGERWVLCLPDEGIETLDGLMPIAGRKAAAREIQDPQLRKDIEALYAKRDRAYKEKDIDSFKSTRSEDYKETLGFIGPVYGDREKADAEAEKQMKANMVVKSISTKIDRMLQGKDKNEAFVESVQTGEATAKGGGSPGSWTIKSDDLLFRTKDGWKIKYRQIVDFGLDTK